MFYNLTIQRATGITHAVHADFSGNKQCEIVVCHGKVLEFLICDPDVKKLHTQLSVEMFGIIRSLVSFRLPGKTKDYLAVGSDSGRIVVLEYNPGDNTFIKVYEDACGKPGCRPSVPGQFLAADPCGRAIVIGAIESHMYAYTSSRNPSKHLLELLSTKVQNPNTILYHIAAVDRGIESKPMFACVEINYKEADKDPTGKAAQTVHQLLTFYMLNSDGFEKKSSSALEERTNLLITVPGGKSGPGGIVVCCENFILYKNYGDEVTIRCPIPRRDHDLDDPDRGVIFVCSATCQTESSFYFLAQTEQGDIFKIRLEVDKNMVTQLKMKYFDTVPVASAFCILDNTFLFVASEFGNHILYEIMHWGDNDREPEFSSGVPLEDGETFFFTPRVWKYLKPVDTIESLSPIMDSHLVSPNAEASPQLWLACGRGPNSTLRSLSLKNSNVICNFNETADAVWSAKRNSSDCWDDLIIVSFLTSNSTYVLAIAETVKEIIDIGLLQETRTLAFVQVHDNHFLQIHPQGVHQIFETNVSDWMCPDDKVIVNCAANRWQIVIALTGGLLKYFIIDMLGQLREMSGYKEMGADVLCMAFSSTEERAKFLVVGLTGNIVQIVSLNEQEGLPVVDKMLMLDAPTSLATSEMTESSKNNHIYLYVGLQNGMLHRFIVNPLTFALMRDHSKYLSDKPVVMFKVKMAVIVVSTNIYLNYYYDNFHLIPLSYEYLDYVSAFSSKYFTEGIIAVSGKVLRFLSLENLNSVFRQASIPLEYTPRKFIIDSVADHLIVIETDHNAITESLKRHRKSLAAQEMVDSASWDEKESSSESAKLFLKNSLPEATFGSPKGGFGQWASIIRVVDLESHASLCRIALDQNEAALSLSLVEFTSNPESKYLLVGIAKDLILNPLVCSGGLIRTYKVSDASNILELMHATEVEDNPAAICSFQGKVLIGIGQVLKLFDLGRKKLLRRCESKMIPGQIVNILAVGDRIVIGTTKMSFVFLMYKQKVNQLVTIASDLNLCYINSVAFLDNFTVAGADKLGNIFLVRIPSITNEDDTDEIDNSLRQSTWCQDGLNCQLDKAEVVASFYVGEIVTSIRKTTLVAGGLELLLYTTLSGSIGVLVPLTDEMRDFFQSLEMHLRHGRSSPSLCSRDHLAFRSYHMPVKNVIDGDLCEQFVAARHNQDNRKVLKMVQEIRSKIVGDLMPFV